jgi:hypothetical protein
MSGQNVIAPADVLAEAASDNEAVGPSMLKLLFGQRFISCGHAAETTTNLVMGRRGGFLAFGMATDFRGESLGMYVSMAPGQARGLATQLLQLADTLDCGKGKQ